jgi:hypothetical protein
MNTQRELATTLRDIIFRLSQMDESIAASLREGLSPAEMEVFCQSLGEAGRRAMQIRDYHTGRSKGVAV